MKKKLCIIQKKNTSKKTTTKKPVKEMEKQFKAQSIRDVGAI